MRRLLLTSVSAAALSLATPVVADTASIGTYVTGMGVLENEWIRAGINLNTGTFGSGSSTSPGLLFDPNGTGTFDPSYDYLTPGSPFDGFSVKVDGTNYANNNTGGTGITKTGEGSGANAITWNGEVADKFQIDMNYSLLAGQPFVNGIATINMLTDADSVSFAKYIDPDSQGMPGDSSATDNVLGYGVIPTTNVAFSEATVSRYALGIYTTDTNVTAGIEGWTQEADGYSGTNYTDADGNALTYGTSDDTIGISWTWVGVSAGDMLEASYAYIFGPSAFDAAEDAVDGGAGGGDTTTTDSWGTVTDVGSATDAAESGATGSTAPTVVSVSDPVAGTAGDPVIVYGDSVTTTATASVDVEGGTEETVTTTVTTPFTSTVTTPTTVTTTYSDGSTTTEAGDPIVTTTTGETAVSNDVVTTTLRGTAVVTDTEGTSTVAVVTSEDGLVTTTTTTTPVTRTSTTPVTQTVVDGTTTTTATLDPIVTTETLESTVSAVATTTVSEAQNTSLPLLIASLTHHEASETSTVQTITREKTTNTTTPVNVTTTVTTVTTATDADDNVTTSTSAVDSVVLRNDVETTVEMLPEFTGRIDQIATAQDAVGATIKGLDFNGVTAIGKKNKFDNGMKGDSKGFTAGGTKVTESGIIIGAGFAAVDTKIKNGADRASATTRAGQLKVGKSFPNADIVLKATHAMTDYTSLRTIGDFSNGATTKGTDSNVNIQFKAKGYIVQPIVGYTVGRTKLDGYAETGSIQSARTIADNTDMYNYGTFGATANLFDLVDITGLYHTDGTTEASVGINKTVMDNGSTIGVNASRIQTDLGSSNSITAGINIKF